VKRGDVVGIVGRNGAGKSTLLKILSRITEPTTGRITLSGRVAALLEVGTGFHPELTGRENIFLNGAILGMRREEIRARFDEIVQFAEIERFIDTPVKRYSSGMYVRLAFAVAAHLEPEILILDEVLAVGDQQFQQKCLGKIGEVASGGRTVLVVSHNMSVVSSLCNRAVLLNAGGVVAHGEADEVLRQYARSASAGGRGESAVARIDASLEVRSLECQPDVVSSGSDVRVAMSLFSDTGTRIEELSILIYAASGERAAILDLRQPAMAYEIAPGRSMTWNVDVRSPKLVEGDYSLGIFCRTAHSRGNHYDIGALKITPGDSSCRVLPYAAQHRGIVELDYNFSV